MTQEKITAFWFRRDLRLHDNTGLTHALQSGKPVLCFFIFDDVILDRLEDKRDKRVVFIHRRLLEINEQLQKMGSAIIVRAGDPVRMWSRLIVEFNIDAVYTNHDYENYAVVRDGKVGALLKENNCSFHTCKDQVIFEKGEITKDDGSPYTVYTPYMKKWRASTVNSNYAVLKSHATEKYFVHFKKIEKQEVLDLSAIGFENIETEFPGSGLPGSLVKNYSETRNFPGIAGTSRLGMHLRFGTVSVRELCRKAWDAGDTWVNELIWREFFMQILWHFPHVADRAFKKEYKNLQWKADEEGFEKWCRGETGYPIVDAGMRELNATGFMHNRVRMLTACFLTKYLLIDWRWGEAYFAQKLLDYDLASNNGNWQWSAGTGCDAAPYFRIFNMDAQAKKFDPDHAYIKKWVPEFQDASYPKPIVEYEAARKRCLQFYKHGLKS